MYNSATVWVAQTPTPKIIDTFTYDVYESENPFKIDFFGDGKINNNYMLKTLTATQNISAEVYSAYTNPFYMTHKIINLPSQAVEIYKKNSIFN